MQDIKPESSKQLAQLLGISQPAVSKLKSRGMPTDSLAAAQAWRDANLNPAKRTDMNPGRQAAQSGAVVKARQALALANRLAYQAHGAVQSGLFRYVAADLKAALRAVPTATRSQVVMPVEVWDALLGPVATAFGHQLPVGTEAAAVPADDDDLADDFVYSAACGEPPPAWVFAQH